MNKYQAVQAFWSGFGWAAFNEGTVPDDALELNNNRYITYESITDKIGNAIFTHATLWHRSTSWTTIHAKAAEIAAHIETVMPPSLTVDNGRLVIRMGTPYAQDMPDEDRTLRKVFLNVQLEFLTNS